ncbi:MAG: Rrf2 family transcriptional regulator [Treponema sp.]|nr:Rrf2 family transcriptional regulator [Treponema sp.]
MRVTTKGRYALRASLALAILEEEMGPVSINTLSKQENISPVFLEQIFFKLRKAGIVSSTRGPGGGFSFAQSLDKITVKQLIDAAGEKVEHVFCDKRIEECERVGECMSHHVWFDVSALVKDYFEGITLASILKKHGKCRRLSGAKT